MIGVGPMEVAAWAIIGFGFGVLFGLSCTLVYVMKQFQRLDQRSSAPTWVSDTMTIRKYGRDIKGSFGSMGNEDLPGQSERDAEESELLLHPEQDSI